MVSKIFFTVTFLLSLALAAFQLNGGAGFGVGTWFPPLYFLLLLAAAYTRRYLKKILKKLYRPLIVSFYSAMAVFCLAFISVCVYIMTYPQAYIYQTPDLVIVLGAKTAGYEPGAVLAGRLDAAIAALNAHPGALCIVSGGQGPDAVISEAEAMRRYLVNNGIQETRISEENRSSDTFENLLFSRRLTERYNIDSARIIIVTSEFHIPRAMMLARRIFGGSYIYAVKADTPLALFSAGITREFFAFVKSFIFDRE